MTGERTMTVEVRTPEAGAAPDPSGTKRRRVVLDVVAVAVILSSLQWGYYLRTTDLAAPLERSHLGWNQAFYGVIGRNVLRQEPLDAFTLGFGAQDSGAPPSGPAQYSGYYPYLHHPPLSFWVAALGIKHVGDDARGVSMPFVLCSVALIAVLAALAWGLYGRTAGALAAMIVASVPMGGWYGRLPSEIGALFLLLACSAVGVFVILARTRSSGWTVPLGILAAMLVLCDWPGLGIVALIGGLAMFSPGVRVKTLTTLALACSLTGVYLLVCFSRVGIPLNVYLELWRSLAANRRDLPPGIDTREWWTTVAGYWIDLFSWPVLAAAAVFLVLVPFRLADAGRRRGDLVTLGLLAIGVAMIGFARGMSVVHDYFSGIAFPGLVLAAAAWPAWAFERLRARSGRLALVVLVLVVAGIAVDACRVHGVWQSLVKRGPDYASKLGPELREHTAFDDVIITNIGEPRDAIFPHRGRLFEGIDPYLAFCADRRFFFSIKTSEQGLAAHDLARRSKAADASMWYLFDPAYARGTEEPEQVKTLRRDIQPIKLRGSRLLFPLGR